VDSPIKKTRDALQKDLDEIRRNKKDRAEAKTDRVFLLTKEEEIESRNRFCEGMRGGGANQARQAQIAYLESINKYQE
jgi:hypothetical protein